MKILVIGNMTWDRVEDRRIPGGSVLYCSRVYAELDHEVSVYGQISDAGAVDKRVDVLECGGVPAEFENLYDEYGARRQRVWHSGDTIPPRVELDSYDIVHVAPVLGEVDLVAWSSEFDTARIVVAGLQGWLREVGEDGWVRPVSPGGRLHRFDLAALSTEDIVGLDSNLVDELRSRTGRVALTDGERGATLYDDDEAISSPGWNVEAVDPTGAGDVFAAALTHGLFARGWDDARAMEFACGAAAHVVSDLGQRALETLSLRLSEYLHE